MDVGLFDSVINNVRALELRIPINRLLPGTIGTKVQLKIRKYFYNKIMERYGIPDVVHVHYPALYPFDAFKEVQDRGAKLVCTEHWTKVQNKTLGKVSIQNLKDCVQHFDNVICVGEPLVQSIRQITGTKRQIDVVPNIVPDIFKYEKTNVADKEHYFRFIGVGRLVKVKCFDLLIQAFAEAFKNNKNVKLDIVGGGEEYNRLKKLILETHCEDQVSLLGVMDRKIIPEYYKKCNALVMSSNLETFGVPIIEAMASGLPVVTTDAMGFQSLFHKEHGYIVPANDKKALAVAMRKLYDNYNKFDKEAIASYAKKYFSEDAIYMELRTIYKGDKG